VKVSRGGMNMNCADAQGSLFVIGLFPFRAALAERRWVR
jgi:hypothetical protein